MGHSGEKEPGGDGKPHWRHVYITVTFVLLILVRPFLPVTFLSRAVTGAMVASAWIAGPRRRVSRWILISLTVLTAVSIVTGLFAPSVQELIFQGSFVAPLSVLAVFFLTFNAVLLLASLLRRRHVLADDMLGAVNLYFIIGFAWAQFYTLLEIAAPRSFQLPMAYGSVPVQVYHELAASKFLYFSFITQATEGYGDIVPVSTAAETLVILQTTVGQLYLALVVAYLLSVHVAQRLSGQ